VRRITRARQILEVARILGTQKHDMTTTAGGSGSKVSSLVHKIKHSGIDSSMVLSAKGDMTPGTSVLVLLTPEAAVDAFAQAFEGQGES
jgi:hypothetical protein